MQSHVSTAKSPCENVSIWTKDLKIKFPVVRPAVSSPVDVMAAKVAKGAGLPPEYGMIISLAAVAAVTGQSRLLKAPANAHYGLFHVFAASVFHSHAEKLLMNIPYQTMLAQVRADVALREPFAAELESGEANLLAELSRLGRVRASLGNHVKKLNLPLQGWDKLIVESNERAKRGQEPKPGTSEHLALDFFKNDTQIATIERELADLRRRRMPIVVTDGGSVNGILRAEAWAFQGTVCNIDAEGRTTASLAEVSKKVREQFLALLSASFDDRPYVEDGKPPRLPSVAHVGKIDRNQLAGMLFGGHSGVALLQRSVVMDLACAPPGALDFMTVCRPVPKFTELIGYLYEQRLAGVVKAYSLSNSAIAVLGGFVAELDRLFRHHAEVARYMGCWPELAMKLALLLHLSRSPDVDGITDETMSQSIGILVASGADGIALMVELASSSRPVRRDLDGDIEVLVGKLNRKGRMTRRQLARSYHGQRAADLDPVVAAAIAKGFIVEHEGLLSVV